MLVFAKSHVGKIRKTNQDAYIALPERNLLAVADGMGGHLGGDIASLTAIKVLEEFVKKHDGNPEEILLEALQEANKRILAASVNNALLEGMGTTLTAALIADNKLVIGHVGDSRAYLLQEGQFHQLTYDHSFVGELLRKGNISIQEADLHPQKNILVRALGTMETIDVDILVFEIEQGSKLLLTSDGLTNMLSKDEIEEVLLSEEPEHAVEKLIALALDRGGTDNITAVLGVMEGETVQ